MVVDTIVGVLASTGVNTDAINPGFEGLIGDARISASGAVAAGPVAPRRGDVNFDGFIDSADLGALLSAWGPVIGSSRADLDASGAVDSADLGILLSRW
jgi:hypothetical protein